MERAAAAATWRSLARLVQLDLDDEEGEEGEEGVGGGAGSSRLPAGRCSGRPVGRSMKLDHLRVRSLCAAFLHSSRPDGSRDRNILCLPRMIRGGGEATITTFMKGTAFKMGNRLTRGKM